MKSIKKDKQYDETETGENSEDYSSKIKINNQHYEMALFLKEMDVNISFDEIPELTRLNLKNYYESLNSVLNTCILGHP